MQPVRHCFHSIRKFRFVYDEVVIFATSARPTIIENDVVVPKISKTVVDEQLGGLEKEIFGHVASECVPIILRCLVSLR